MRLAAILMILISSSSMALDVREVKPVKEQEKFLISKEEMEKVTKIISDYDAALRQALDERDRAIKKLNICADKHMI